MRALYTRLFTDENGISRFEDLEMELLPGFAAPPAEPLHFADFVCLGQSRWVGGTSDWRGDAPHPVPRRMLVIPIHGEFDVTAGDGTTRRFKPGDVLIAEDTWGSGHSSQLIGEGESINLFIDLLDSAQEQNWSSVSHKSCRPCKICAVTDSGSAQGGLESRS
jgi:hypothetical protein